jgi:hypothetical protein
MPSSITSDPPSAAVRLPRDTSEDRKCVYNLLITGTPASRDTYSKGSLRVQWSLLFQICVKAAFSTRVGSRLNFISATICPAFVLDRREQRGTCISLGDNKYGEIVGS